MARVLLVDDNHDACELLSRVLRRFGHDTSCHTSARDALAYLSANTPDLIILDVMMPEMTGLDVLRSVRADARTAGITVMMYTALSDEKTRREAQRLGANSFIVKGGGWPALQAEIQKHLGTATETDPAAPPPDAE